MLLAFSIAPAGAGELPPHRPDAPADSVSEAVAAALRVVRDSGLAYQLDSMFTTIEGDWDAVMTVIKAAVQEVSHYGSRVSLVMKADIRPGHSGELTGKVDRVNQLLGQG